MEGVTSFEIDFASKKVLHIMNKMNIPAPFRMALPTPPLPFPIPSAPPQSPPRPPTMTGMKSNLNDLSSEGVRSLEVDLEKQKVVVVGDNIILFEVLNGVSKIMFAKLWLDPYLIDCLARIMQTKPNVNLFSMLYQKRQSFPLAILWRTLTLRKFHY
ncbi:hypothetical protein ZIOFF_006161 [Zingiber officinale]|uniref:Uncharacterized protein n=1 Tax=Zingiber officinale TaxID=94328 RepID=A0A8J5IC50_ZINOF|nr:hypothetical protein ZIOFF_006161 [Zingiber officinale]